MHVEGTYSKIGSFEDQKYQSIFLNKIFIFYLLILLKKFVCVFI